MAAVVLCQRHGEVEELPSRLSAACLLCRLSTKVWTDAHSQSKSKFRFQILCSYPVAEQFLPPGQSVLVSLDSGLSFQWPVSYIAICCASDISSL